MFYTLMMDDSCIAIETSFDQIFFMTGETKLLLIWSHGTLRISISSFITVAYAVSAKNTAFQLYNISDIDP